MWYLHASGHTRDAYGITAVGECSCEAMISALSTRLTNITTGNKPLERPQDKAHSRMSLKYESRTCSCAANVDTMHGRHARHQGPVVKQDRTNSGLRKGGFRVWRGVMAACEAARQHLSPRDTERKVLHRWLP